MNKKQFHKKIKAIISRYETTTNKLPKEDREVEEAIEFCVKNNYEITIPQIQRKCKVGYFRACEIKDLLNEYLLAEYIHE